MPAWITVPRTAGRITSKELGLVINTADPYSVEVGEYYIQARKLAPEQVLRVELPLVPALGADEFRAFDRRVSAHFGAGIQALALAWARPYAVECNSITAALALGFDGELCQQTCAPPLRFSPYFNSASTRPYTDLGLRPAMLLAAADVHGAKAMIDRGVASDFTLGLRGAPPVNAYFVGHARPSAQRARGPVSAARTCRAHRRRGSRRADARAAGRRSRAALPHRRRARGQARHASAGCPAQWATT